MSYLISRNVAITALNEAQIEYDVNYRGLGEAKEIIDSLPTVNAIVIPDNATNGEVVENLFSEEDVELFRLFMTHKWWNAPYGGKENKQ